MLALASMFQGTVGLIYVNPGGPLGFEGNIKASAEDITRVFGTGMSFNIQETTALVGGGHAFGKAHGACPNPSCPAEDENCNNARCSDGGVKTSGWEGAWTTNPAVWDNQFFQNLFDYNWVPDVSPAGNDQWKPEVGPDIMMLTSDLALTVPPYREFSEKYSKSKGALEKDFARVWYKLTTSDMGPSVRCLGDDVPKPEPFQNDLPAAPKKLPDYAPVRAAIEKILEEDESSADEFINLGYKCASTYRDTDHHGGCNGSRIRFPPQSDWHPETETALEKLEGVKEAFKEVSYTDLIVLAALTALEFEKPDLNLKFCGGGVDTTEAIENGKDLSPRVYSSTLVTFLDDCQVKGLTKEEGMALLCRESVGSGYFQDLLNNEGKEDELALVENTELMAIAEAFAYSEERLLVTFEEAWTKMMTADRFLNNRENACDGVNHLINLTP